MIRSSSLILCISFILVSCSFFSQKIDDLAQKNQKLSDLSQAKKDNFCEEKTRLQYFAEDESSLKFFKNLDLFNKKIPFVQKAIMYSLLEMNRRPDLISPSTRLQVYMTISGSTYYFDFYPKDPNDSSKYSYMRGLSYLSEKFLNGTSLSAIADEMDNSVPQQLPVTQELEDFLHKYRSDLQQSELMTSRFFKGDETITRFETFHRMSFRNIVNNFSITKSEANSFEIEKFKLAPFVVKSVDMNVNCNVDLNKNNGSADEVLSSDNTRIHTMGLIEGDNTFLAVSSGNFQRPLKFEKNFIFVQMKPSPFPAPICEFKDHGVSFSLFSAEGRSPAQHLKHLIAYEIGKVQNPAEVNELLKFSRHLFLNDPDRILYESKRGRKTQLDFFLAMNFPIYHADNLGDVFGSITYPRDGQKKLSLIIDDRDSSRLSCQK
jgi:hypothetical protein